MQTPKDRRRDEGWVDDIYQEAEQLTGDTRSNSARLDRDASGLLSGVETQFLDNTGMESDSIYPVNRALYDPDLDANWIELTVSTGV
jgi:hypothetical protein